MKTVHQISVLILILLFQVPSFGSVLTDLNPDQLGRDFLNEKKEISGQYHGGTRWGGVFCNGSYDYTAFASAIVRDINFDLKSDGTIDISVEIKDAYARVDGSYRSLDSLCVPLSGWLGIGVDKIEIRSRVDINEDNRSKIKIQVLSLKFGTIHMGDFVPSIVEDALTSSLNRTMEWLWTSSLGTWLEQKISDQISQHLPEN